MTSFTSYSPLASISIAAFLLLGCDNLPVEDPNSIETDSTTQEEQRDATRRPPWITPDPPPWIGSADEENAVEIEISGRWQSGFGGTEEISSDAWVTAWSTLAIVSFDNDTNVAIVQNPPDDAFFPDKFSKIEWTEIEADQFFYCTIDFGLDTAEAAEQSENRADSTDPATTGCGGFPWTDLTRLDE